MASSVICTLLTSPRFAAQEHFTFTSTLWGNANAPGRGGRKMPKLLLREGIKPGTNARDPGPKYGTKFCQQNIAVKHACIELKFGLNVDYRLFFEMHVSIFLHLPYFYYMQVKYRTMSWNTDPGPAFSVLTMSRNS